MLIAVSTCVLILIAVGLVFRRRPRVHLPCMLSAFALDLGLVLYIELNRHAIQTVGEAIHRPFPQGVLLFHVMMSLLTLALYVLMLRLGFGLLKGRESVRLPHRYLGSAFVVCRLANYVSSFFVAGLV
jgi:uncharacterized membrane protein YozB (DUF420 family)